MVKEDVSPIVGSVTRGAHLGIVVSWRQVARHTVNQSAVVQSYVAPTVGGVAIGAAPIIVSRWDLSPVTGVAPGVAGVVEPVLTPVGGVVAGVAQLVVVRVVRMAFGALEIVCVVKGYVRPIDVVVAVGALAIIVPGRNLTSMTIHAVGKAGVVKPVVGPVLDIVAIRALSRIVAVFQGVAVPALGKAVVIKDHIRPVGVDVATGALAAIVVFRGIARQVARRTVAETVMVKAKVVPVGGAGMAIDAGARVLVDRVGAAQ